MTVCVLRVCVCVCILCICVQAFDQHLRLDVHLTSQIPPHHHLHRTQREGPDRKGHPAKVKGDHTHIHWFLWEPSFVHPLHLSCPVSFPSLLHRSLYLSPFLFCLCSIWNWLSSTVTKTLGSDWLIGKGRGREHRHWGLQSYEVCLKLKANDAILMHWKKPYFSCLAACLFMLHTAPKANKHPSWSNLD